MGLYFDHGVAVVGEILPPGGRSGGDASDSGGGGEMEAVVIVSPKQLDDRLSRSRFFVERGDEWFDVARNMHRFGSQDMLRLAPTDAAALESTLVLTDEEKSRIQTFLAEKGPTASVAWYETFSASSTL